MFHRTKIILKFVWQHKRPQRVKTILRKNRAGAINILDFQLYYKVTVIKTLWYWHKTRHRYVGQSREQRNKPTLTWAISNKGGKNLQWGKDSLLNVGTVRSEINKMNCSLTPCTKINFKIY